jgi:putative membrane protein
VQIRLLDRRCNRKGNDFFQSRIKGLNKRIEEGKMRKALLILVISLFVLVFVLDGGARAQMGPGMMDWGHWGYGMGWFWTIIMVVFWIAVIVGIIFLIRWFVISTSAGGRAVRSEDSPLEILKRRYARGEINKEEFEEKKKDLA